MELLPSCTKSLISPINWKIRFYKVVKIQNSLESKPCKYVRNVPLFLKVFSTGYSIKYHILTAVNKLFQCKLEPLHSTMLQCRKVRVENVIPVLCQCWQEVISPFGVSNLHAGVGPVSWWHNKMETFSTLLALCAGNSRVNGEFPSQRPVTRSFDVLFDLRLE